MKYNRQQLVNDFHNESKIKFLFFWGHAANKDGSIGKSCFSQWWIAPFIVDGITYKSTEHWMMAEKARLFNDGNSLGEIINCESPAEAKKWGRKVVGFIPEEWDKQKYQIVKQGNMYKFSQHQDLKEYLLNTKNRVLVEASPRDRIWGIGMAQSNEKAQNPEFWRGENLLGFALMEVRDELI
ncbi:NADAR family protein [Maribacter algarum]|uniref:NADAR family protein n=1 Tax=Maribacter algarum (ex Zhang et al. 2020) TaxID=2578118 RepID=A0A5S3PIV5_9FLAO|nr:NADAR family protein [Maribacter algarum]TMM51965.1 NADAR family protein [Maribacter algarum]